MSGSSVRRSPETFAAALAPARMRLAGATTPTQTACAAGRYSLAAASVCTGCPAGALTQPAHRITWSPCPTRCVASQPPPLRAGRYGATAAMALSACTGTATAGYYTAAGSWDHAA